MNEKRKGNTGVWTKTFESTCGNCGSKVVLALSEWNTQHEFHITEWEQLPVIEQ